MKLSLELSDQSQAGYGSVHRAGCRDLRDAEPIGEAERMSEIPTLVESATGWTDTDPITAPCVTLPA